MSSLSKEQLLDAINNGIKAYYEDQIHVHYPYMTLVNNIIGVESGLDAMKLGLTELYEEKNTLLTLIDKSSVDLEAIYSAFEKEEDDEAMIAKFESAIAFTTEGQKYAFLSAINALN